MKKKSVFILMWIFIIIITGIVIFALIDTKQNKLPSLEPEYSTNDCIKKGNVCSANEIKNGILMSVAVNNKKSYDFYVIDNDENSLTLIMNENIADNVDWHSETLNMKGPVGALMKIYEKTKKWTNIKPINNYVYEDYGKKYSEDLCISGTNDNYLCENTVLSSRGYDKIFFSKDEKYVDYNLVPSEEGENILQRYDLMDYDLRARLITVEEMAELENASWLASNLENDEAYWTLSSSTAVNTGYSLGAYAIVKGENSAGIESLFVSNSLNNKYKKIGIRPVITVEKR